MTRSLAKGLASGECLLLLPSSGYSSGNSCLAASSNSFKSNYFQENNVVLYAIFKIIKR